MRTRCVIDDRSGQSGFNSPLRIIADMFSMRFACCTHPGAVRSSEALGNVIARSVIEASPMTNLWASKDWFTTKSSNDKVFFSPTTSTHWRNAALKEQSNTALLPPEYLSKQCIVIGTPSSVVSKMWQQTSCGSSQPNPQSEARMQYQPKSPRAPKGSVAAFIRMLLLAHAGSFPKGIEKALTMCLTGPSSPSSITFVIIDVLLLCMSMVLSMNCTPSSLQVWMHSSVSRKLVAMGFSQSTCFFARAALSTHSLRMPVGKGMYTASTAGSANNASYES
mmetsp:Transcript_29278/g.83207  ORF Transcript_29278/g.83207 Transcript_29278/m.83207 type:complete len:278 (+) Transcript_29278:91-924(+)